MAENKEDNLRKRV